MESGIACLDTARAYGAAEERIGRWLSNAENKPLIVTKLPALDVTSMQDASQHVREKHSLSSLALGLSLIDGYVVHRSSDIRHPGIIEALQRLQEEGLVGGFGVSAYTTEEVERVLGLPGVAIVQVPLNVFDCSMYQSGVLERCRSAGIAVFARSVFMQGAFFIQPDHLPLHLQPAHVAITHLHSLAREVGYTVAELALAFVLSVPGVSSVIIGVDSLEQLRANFRVVERGPLDSSLMATLQHLGKGLPRSVVDPSRWPKPNASLERSAGEGEVSPATTSQAM